MLDLRGTVAVVTGGARRLGASISTTLAQAGCDVVINYRSSQTDAELVAEQVRAAGTRALTVQADVARSSDVERLLETTQTEFGRVDIVVANAGAFRRTPIATITDADWDDMLDNNLRCAFLCGQRFGLHMRAHNGGCVVMLADVAGMRPWADYLPYSIAKAGVIALTRGLAVALAPSVRVNAIAPGPVLFPEGFDPAARRREAARTLVQREGSAQNVADAVLALVRNDYITGVILPVDGGRVIA